MPHIPLRHPAYQITITNNTGSRTYTTTGTITTTVTYPAPTEREQAIARVRRCNDATRRVVLVISEDEAWLEENGEQIGELFDSPIDAVDVAERERYDICDWRIV